MTGERRRPRSGFGHQPHRAGLIAVLAAGKLPMHEVAQDVVETIDGLHGGPRVERLGERAHADVDQQSRTIGEVLVERSVSSVILRRTSDAMSDFGCPGLGTGGAPRPPWTLCGL